MSIARHHAEWLSLVPVSGPFLSLSVLMEAFNTGLEPHDPEHIRLLRQEYANWQDSFEKSKADPVPHQHWIKFVLTKTLDLDERVLAEGQAIPQTLQVEVPEHHELLRPSIVVVDPNTQKPRLLVQTYPRSQELTSYVANSHWKASPDTRMTELLHGSGVRLGLVTNGEHWMLVDAPKGETTGYSSWYATLWLEETITLRAFRSLLSASRFFNVPDDQTLESLFTKSASNQQEVTDQLGYQVRRAVEVLIHSLDRADQDFGRELLAEVTPEQLYEAALTVMMRLVFLFCAEERGLLLLGHKTYDRYYAASTLWEEMRKEADQWSESILEYRYDAWPRLLALFRIIYGGARHESLMLPAYGGNLFNPDRFPFLEGRKRGTTWRDVEASPLPVNNRTVLHLLEALQLLQVKVPGGGPAEARRLSFRALDIEQIGHVYEGLLDHTAKRAGEPFLGLAGTREKEPEIPLAELEREAWGGDREAGTDQEPKSSFWKFLKEKTGRSEAALKKAFFSWSTDHDPRSTDKFRTACQDSELWKRVKPFAGLVRLDDFGYPVVIPKGSVFVTAGTDRRSSGTHYTPRSLTEPIVQYTLEPLVYVGPAEGKSKGEWKLKSAKELLELKICDMACGSGAFLVQACRYMAARLLEAWDEAERGSWTVDRGPKGKEDDGTVVSGLGGLEGGDGLGRRMLPGDEDVPQGRTLRNDEPDTSSSGVDTGKHSGGTRQGINQGVLELSEHSQGFTDGTRNSSSAMSTSRSVERNRPDPTSGSQPAHQPNDLPSSPVTRKTPLIRSPVPGPPSPIPEPRSPVHGPRSPIPRITPHGSRSTGSPGEMLIPDDPDERQTYALRIVAQRCLYGVDKNPLAVEMAKLSLWLLTLAKNMPFEFLDHSIRCGDSLVGIHNLDQLQNFSLDGKGDDRRVVLAYLDDKIRDAIALRRKITEMQANTVEDVEAQDRMLREANEKIDRLKCAADMLISAEFVSGSGANKRDAKDDAAIKVALHFNDSDLKTFQNVVLEALTGNRDSAFRSTVHEPPFTLSPFHWPLEFPEVIVKRGGFDAIVGNPPFMGGQKITGFLGTPYREYLVNQLSQGKRGSADLCAYFFLRAAQLLRAGAGFGLIATNTIGQGDTREVGFDLLLAANFIVNRAHSSRPWPGIASLEISIVWVRKGGWNGLYVLDEKPSEGITAYLTPTSTVTGQPYRLKANEGKSFQGSIVLGMGFVLEPEEAQRLIEKDPRNKDVLFPYLNGEDLNSRPDQSPSRWVINFFDWSIEKAMEYPDCFRIVEEKVKPERTRKKDDGQFALRKPLPQKWWIYAEKRPELYRTIAGMERVLVFAQTSKTKYPAILEPGPVFDQKTVVIASQEFRDFALLCSHIHFWWVLTYGSSLRTDAVYTPSDCFETFPFPNSITEHDSIGECYHEHRQQIMLARQEGLTKTYNRFHDLHESSTDIQKLRELHVEMDIAVAAAYGWSDLDLDHGFHKTKQGLRYTISEPARLEVLARLLKLNHERYAEEVKQGLHEKKGKRGSGTVNRGPKKAEGKDNSAQSLFPGEESSHEGRNTPPPLFSMEGLEVAFPSTDWERLLCGLLCDLVAEKPGLRFDAYLDAIGIALSPQKYNGFLIGDERTKFTTLARKLSVARGRENSSIPMDDLENVLLQNNAIRKSADQTLSKESSFETIRASYPKIDPKLVELIHKAASTLRENQGFGKTEPVQAKEISSQNEEDRKTLAGDIK